MLSKTRRNVARVVIAGALVAVPLSALAVTASAAEPDASAQSQIPLQGTDIDRHHHHHHDGDGDHGPGNWIPGPGNYGAPGVAPFQQFPPPTGSAG
ncbi:hypothetical protein ACIHDR_03125 [Nocardia sp. NPDC052278]|uniref:hypothetical protein n=1 Tax=unclassified Nocardia TaxID=2637762 RepID=UPI0036BD2282